MTLTKEEIIEKVAALDANIAENTKKLEDAVARFNKAVTENKAREQAKAESEIAELKKSLNADNRDVALYRISVSVEDNPAARMREVCKTLTYETKYAKISENKETKRKQASIETKKGIMDLSFDPEYFGADKQWYYYIEKLGYVLTQKVAKGLGKTAADVADGDYSTYRMSTIAQELNIPADNGSSLSSGDDIYNVSNNKLTAVVKNLIGFMLGAEYSSKATNHDAFYLLTTFTKDGKVPLSVRTKRSNALAQNVMQVCHHILTDKGYEVEAGQYKKPQ